MDWDKVTESGEKKCQLFVDCISEVFNRDACKALTGSMEYWQGICGGAGRNCGSTIKCVCAHHYLASVAFSCPVDVQLCELRDMERVVRVLASLPHEFPLPQWKDETVDVETCMIDARHLQ
jgi:hypothetical protein